jgi:hypothetical protein
VRDRGPASEPASLVAVDHRLIVPSAADFLARLATDTLDTPPRESLAMSEVSEDGVAARYRETDDERLLVFERDGRTATIAQNLRGYAMLAVRPSPDGDELERYYGFDMALDHAAELLGVSPNRLPVPDEAADMGM